MARARQTKLPSPRGISLREDQLVRLKELMDREDRSLGYKVREAVDYYLSELDTRAQKTAA